MKQPFSVVITGEWPGAGQTTTAQLLSQKLGFERVYAGFLFRKFAHVWHVEKHRFSWQEFETDFIDNKINLDNYLFTEADFNEKVLHQWQHQLKSAGTPDMWDKLIETQSLIALQKPKKLVEAKIGVLLDKTNLLPPKKISHTIYKFLLTCPPEISSHRVIKRKIKNQELPHMNNHSSAYQQLVRDTTQETISRHLRDWERYEKIYHIKRSDIYKSDITQIPTEQKSPHIIINEIISYLPV